MYVEEATVAAGLVIKVNQELQLTKTLQFMLKPGSQQHFPRPTIVAHKCNEEISIRKQEMHIRDSIKYCWLLLNVLVCRKEMKRHSHSWKDMRELSLVKVDQ